MTRTATRSDTTRLKITGLTTSGSEFDASRLVKTTDKTLIDYIQGP